MKEIELVFKQMQAKNMDSSTKPLESAAAVSGQGPLTPCSADGTPTHSYDIFHRVKPLEKNPRVNHRPRFLLGPGHNGMKGIPGTMNGMLAAQVRPESSSM